MNSKQGFKLSLMTIALLTSINAYAVNYIDDQSSSSTATNSDNIVITGPMNQVYDSLFVDVDGRGNTVRGLQEGSVRGSGNVFDGSSIPGGMFRTSINGSSNDVQADNSTIISNNGFYRGADITAIGNNQNLNGFNLYAIGNNNSITGENSGAIGNNNTVNATNSVALGDNLNVNRDNVVDIGGKNLANVADAVQQGDAVNLRQLQQGLASVGGGAAYDDSGIRNELARTNGRVDHLERQIDKVEEKMSRGIASVAAMQQAPLVPGKTTIAVGGATYNSQSAIGASMTKSVNDRFALTAGIAMAFGDSPVIKGGFVWTFD